MGLLKLEIKLKNTFIYNQLKSTLNNNREELAVL